VPPAAHKHRGYKTGYVTCKKRKIPRKFKAISGYCDSLTPHHDPGAIFGIPLVKPRLTANFTAIRSFGVHCVLLTSSLILGYNSY
jgi:hypothetical protein